MRALLAPLMVLLLVVTACGPIPRPCPQESNVEIGVRAHSTRAPMRGEIPTGQVPGDPKRFALKVSERLLTLGIPAEPQWFSMAAAPALETHRLRSVASVAAGQGATEKVEVAWSLVSPAGNEKSLAVAQIVLPRDVWESENTKAVDDAAFVSAATIARALETSLPTFDLAEGDGPRLVVLPVEGATGDGSERLEYAITPCSSRACPWPPSRRSRISCYGAWWISDRRKAARSWSQSDGAWSWRMISLKSAR